jgi:uncharacterized tellurite resistance protein B-like protein
MKPNFSTSENIQKLVCENCSFKCSKKGDWNRHILTDKHKSLKNPKVFTSENIKKKYTCYCGRNYKHQSTLCAHKKLCKGTNMNEDSINMQDKDALILHLLKQNGDLQKSLIEMSKEKSITNNNHNNSHNKTFNLQFFLNETCKDALNITDFVSSIKPSLDDLENTGRRGYIEGISNIILKNLNSLEQYRRPIHCSDHKREILYIKDDNHWIKESEEKPVLTKAIKVIANENIKMIKDWRILNPDCTDVNSKKNNLYLKIVSNSMSGSDKEECDKNMSKIISNVAKEVIIEKE